MPELPEVEAARRAIEENCVGKMIKKAIVADDSKVIDGVSAGEFEQSITGKTIVSAHRKGKNLWLRLDSPPFPSFQFGMAGAVYIKGVAVTQYIRSAVKDGDEWPSKYSKVFIELDDGMEFSFTDKRRFAKVRLLKDPTSVPPISELGPDALLEPMNAEEFVASLSKKKIAIKALLLDQSYISGIGNWIADEVLYQAKIHPLQTSSSLSKESCATLQKCIKEVIEKAVEVGADSIQYPNDWIFHSREKKPGKAFVDGKKIEFITAGGRTSAIVPELQKLSGDQAEKAANKQKKPSGRGKGRKNDSDDEKLNESEADADDDGNAESESDDENAKLNKGKKKKVVKAAKKKVTGKRNLKESDDEDDIAGDTKPKKGVKPKSQAKRKLPSKGKPNESDDEGNDNGNDDDEIQPKVEDIKKSKVQKTTVSRQSSRNLRKKAN